MKTVSAILMCLLGAALTAQVLPLTGAGRSAASAGGGACTNTFTAGLVAWYKADAGLTCTGGCSTGNAVTAWADQSGNANTLTASTAGTYQATGTNGLPAVQLASASSQSYTFGTALDFSGTGSNAATIFVTLKLNSTSSKGGLISGAAGSLTYWFANTSFQGADETAVAQLLAGTSTSPDTSWHQFNLNFANGGTISARLGRASDGSAGGAAVVASSTETVMGHNGNGGEFIDAKIGEILIYSASVTGGNLATVETYLNCRWGI